MGDMWGSAYKIINRANVVLDRVPAITMDPALRTRVLSEAHFLRALAYFDLVRCFGDVRSEEHTSELQSQSNLVCRLLLEKKKKIHRRSAYLSSDYVSSPEY